MRLDTGEEYRVLRPSIMGVNGARETRFRFEVMDRNEELIGDLKGVKGGTLAWSSKASIHSSGSIDMSDLGDRVDWLNSRVRITVFTKDDDGEEVATQVGVYIPTAPVHEWDDGARTYTVELLDKLSMLDTDIVTDARGNAETFTVPKGTNIIRQIKAIIADLGETSPAIVEDEANETAQADMVFPAGTSRLKIINDLLDSANYFSLWCDGAGRFRVTKYKAPKDRTPIYQMEEPLAEGETSLLGVSWTHDEDIYSIPNRVVAVQQGDDEEEGMSSVADLNILDPNSRFNQKNRGRYITEVYDGVEATSQANLDGWAERKLDDLVNAANKVEIEHVFLPDLLMNDTILFRAGDVEMVGAVTNTEFDLDPQAMVKTKLRSVLSGEEPDDTEEGGDA